MLCHASLVWFLIFYFLHLFIQQIINESFCWYPAKKQWRDLVATFIGYSGKTVKQTKKLHPQYLISEHIYFPMVFHTQLDLDEACPSIPDFPTHIHPCLYFPQAPSVNSLGRTPGSPHLMSKLVAREAENHQAPGKATLQLIELVEVSGSCSSEWCDILNQHRPASKRVKIYLLPIQADGTEIIERLGDVSHGEAQWALPRCVSPLKWLNG